MAASDPTEPSATDEPVPPPGGTAPPELTVVVPSVNGWQDLERCLSALFAQQGGVVLEVIVADRVGDPVRVPLRRNHPGARLLEAEPGTPIPALRAWAFREARADVVGVIEDHVLVPPDWAEHMLAAHADGAQVVGGAVVNAADERLVDRAAFLCEYSHCLAPPEGPASWVTGNNVTYRRALLRRFDAVVAEGGWEDRLHEAMRDAGIPLLGRPDIVVGHRMHYTVGAYLHQRYLYSRSYAGMRARGSAPWRIVRGAASLLLPPVLLWRIGRRARSHPEQWKVFWRSLPLQLVFVTAWAAGEVVGWWRGPGRALEQVR